MNSRQWLIKLQNHHRWEFTVLPSGKRGKKAVEDFENHSVLPHRYGYPIRFDDKEFQSKFEAAYFDDGWEISNGNGWDFEMRGEPIDIPDQISNRAMERMAENIVAGGERRARVMKMEKALKDKIGVGYWDDLMARSEELKKEQEEKRRESAT